MTSDAEAVGSIAVLGILAWLTSKAVAFGRRNLQELKEIREKSGEALVDGKRRSAEADARRQKLCSDLSKEFGASRDASWDELAIAAIQQFWKMKKQDAKALLVRLDVSQRGLKNEEEYIKKVIEKCLREMKEKRAK